MVTTYVRGALMLPQNTLNTPSACPVLRAVQAKFRYVLGVLKQIYLVNLIEKLSWVCMDVSQVISLVSFGLRQFIN